MLMQGWGMPMFQFYNPVKLIVGSNSIDDFVKITADSDLNIRKILILTGKKSLERSGRLDTILGQFKDKETFVYNNIPSNPEISELYDIKLETDKFNYDCIIAIGGGSVLDIGKCLAAFKNLKVDSYIQLKQGIINKEYQNYIINTPIIAVPTTAGTGSEVTCWATVWDKKNNKKYSVEDKRTYPRMAIIEPILTISLPIKLTASTALDALSHALEAYWSKKTNPIVRMYALKSIESIMQNLNNLLDDLSDLNLRTKIMQGSLYAGLAFSNTKTTACHSISYPLTAKYNISHGIATSITLASFLNINKEFIINKNDLLNAFDVRKISEVEDLIKDIFKKSKIPFRLRDYGVEKSDIDSIVQNSFTPGRMDNNPVEVTRELLKGVLEHIY